MSERSNMWHKVSEDPPIIKDDWSGWKCVFYWTDYGKRGVTMASFNKKTGWTQEGVKLWCEIPNLDDYYKHE